MKITVLIPAYMPDKTLIDLAKELRGKGFSILVVDDGSGADFDGIFRETKEFAELVRLEKNGGKGAALKTGFSKLPELFPDSEAVITADADGQHSVNDICRVAQELEKGASCVITERNLGKNIPARSKFGNDLSRFVYAATTGRYLYDTQSGLRGFAIEHCDWLSKVGGNKYDYEMSVLLHIDKMNLPITTMPIDTIYINKNASSHFNPVKDTLRIYGRFMRTLLFSLIANILNHIAVIVSLVVFGEKYIMPVILISGVFFTALSITLNKCIAFKKMSASIILKMAALSLLRICISAGLCALGKLIGLPYIASYIISLILHPPIQFLIPYWLSRAKN